MFDGRKADARVKGKYGKREDHNAKSKLSDRSFEAKMNAKYGFDDDVDDSSAIDQLQLGSNPSIEILRKTTIRLLRARNSTNDQLQQGSNRNMVIMMKTTLRFMTTRKLTIVQLQQGSKRNLAISPHYANLKLITSMSRLIVNHRGPTRR